MGNNYIILKDGKVRLSDVLNDCTNLCVPAYKGEPLSSILNKICAKIPPPSSGGGVITEEDPIFSGSPAFGISITDISHWDSAYNNQIVSAAFSGTTTKTLTLTQQDGGTITATFTDLADQIVTITEGAGIDVTGTYPNFTITHQDTSSVTNLDTSGAQVIDTLTFDTFGHVQTVTTRNLTLADLGYVAPDPTRFGVSGEDDTAGENRLFNLGTNSFDLINANVGLSFSPGETGVMFQSIPNGLSYFLLQTDTLGSYAASVRAQTVLGAYGEINVDPITAASLRLRYNDVSESSIEIFPANILHKGDKHEFYNSGFTQSGLLIDFPNAAYQFGALGTGNNTRINIDDASQTLAWIENSLGAASNGYVWTLVNNTTGEGAWQQSTGSGAIIDGIYRFDDSTVAADPGSGDLRFNSATYASVTEIYISQLSDPGTDVGNILGTLEAGDVIYIQDRNDATKWFRADINAAPTDNGAWWTITVDFVNSGGTLFGNNQELNVLVSLNAAGGGTPQRFGVAGEDDTATADRNFDLDVNRLTMNSPTGTFAFFEGSISSQVLLQTQNNSGTLAPNHFAYIDLSTNGEGINYIDQYLYTETNEDVEIYLQPGLLTLFVDTNSNLEFLGIDQDNTTTKVLALDASDNVRWIDKSTIGGGSGTVNTGAQYKAAYYTTNPTGTVVDDWIGVNFGQTNINTQINSQATTEVLLEMNLAASQTANAYTLKNSGGTTLTQITKDGYLRLPAGTSSSLATSALTIGTVTGVSEWGLGGLLMYESGTNRLAISGQYGIFFRDASSWSLDVGNQINLGSTNRFRLTAPAVGTFQLGMESTQQNMIFKGANNAGADATAFNLTLQPGAGTGNSTLGGSFIVQTSDATGSGSTVQSYTDKFRISKLGYVTIVPSGSATAGQQALNIGNIGLFDYSGVGLGIYATVGAGFTTFIGDTGIIFKNGTATFDLGQQSTFSTVNRIRMSAPAEGHVKFHSLGLTAVGILEIAGGENTSATVRLTADEGDDATDTWNITATTTNNLTLVNNSNTRLTLGSNGQFTLGAYGSGTFTGTATKWLAVTSAGLVIEENAPTGSGGYTVHTVTTTPYTVAETSGKVVLLVDTSATGTNGNATINLPTAVGNTSEVIIKQILAANVITVDPDGTEEIDGSSTYTGLTNINESIAIINDNANWFII